MNRKDVVGALEKAGVDPRFYSVSGSCGDEQYCLKETEKGFVVFYSERGFRNEERFFETESEACEYFVPWVLKDRSIRR